MPAIRENLRRFSRSAGDDLSRGAYVPNGAGRRDAMAAHLVHAAERRVTAA
ncbi:Hypothetical protein A7982_08739 [Minicystis rosea]|nr:Hypothetical protein A7982_08739 [Minicystis rosea]